MTSLITASGRARASRRQTTTTRTLISEVQLNRRSGKIAYRVVLTLVIVGFTLVFIGPLYFLFTDGLKSTQEVIATPPTLYPHALHPSNYVQAWNRLDVGRMLWNSVYYAAGALAFQLVFDVTAAYSLSKLRPVFGNVVLFLMLATLMIPATVLVVPQYVTIVNMPFVHWNLVGSPEAIWLPSVANAFNIFLLKRFFDSIPTDYIDAASVDGASRLMILWKIVLPMSRPILGVVSIFATVAVWKDFLWPLLVEYGYTPTREGLNVGIWQATYGTPENLIIAASAMAAIPTIVFFLIFQRNIMAGLHRRRHPRLITGCEHARRMRISRPRSSTAAQTLEKAGSPCTSRHHPSHRHRGRAIPGGAAPRSTSSTSAASPMRAATGSGTSPAPGPICRTWPNLASTQSGSTPGTRRRSSTPATTSPTTAALIPCSARWLMRMR